MTHERGAAEIKQSPRMTRAAESQREMYRLSHTHTHTHTHYSSLFFAPAVKLLHKPSTDPPRGGGEISAKHSFASEGKFSQSLRYRRVRPMTVTVDVTYLSHNVNSQPFFFPPPVFLLCSSGNQSSTASSEEPPRQRHVTQQHWRESGC